MNDHELEDTLRTTFTGRAGTVARGPGWDGAALASTRRRRMRWIAPLAAAAVVLAVVGVVLGIRDSGGPNGSTSPVAHHAIPSGMKAVDALGVEVFVPASWRVDDGPCPFDGVRRPISLPDSWRGAKCAPSLVAEPSVIFLDARPVMANGVCYERIALDGESGCVTRETPDRVRPGGYGLTVWWPQHQVGLSTFTPTLTAGLRVLQSAHAVPVDRNGCAARADATELAGSAQSTHPAGLFDSELLPAATQQLGVCWFIANRLVASALLDQEQAQRVLHVANHMAPKWPAPARRPALPACDSLAKTDGVMLISHQRGRSDRTAVADFAACDGQRTARSATADFLTSPELASAIQHSTGIPLTLDYRATN